MFLRQANKITRLLILKPVTTQPKNVYSFLAYQTCIVSDKNANKDTIKIKATQSAAMVKQSNIELTAQNSIIEADCKSTISIPKKFTKSNTQNAITLPLKLPRLANPYPDPVKCMQSDVISDDEKARLMQEEIQYELKKQEYETQKKQASTEIIELKKWEPRKRKPRNSTKAENKNIKTENRKYSTSSNITYSFLSVKPQIRKYSTASYSKKKIRNFASFSKAYCQEIESLSELQQCELILKRLQDLYPEYKDMKKPVCMPGSEEERNFVIKTLKILGKHKSVNRKLPAPVPSYSEVKTFIRQPSNETTTFKSNCRLSNVLKHSSNSKDDLINKKSDSKTILRYYSTEKKEINQNNDESFLNLFNDELNSKEFEPKISPPYPSYSECVDNNYESEIERLNKLQKQFLNNYKIKQTQKQYFGTVEYNNKTIDGVRKTIRGANKTIGGVRKTIGGERKTIDGDFKTKQTQFIENNKQAVEQLTSPSKKKPPCKNPYKSNLPVCDYKNTDRKMDKKKKSRQKVKTDDKNYSVLVNTTQTNKKRFSLLQNLTDWLNSWNILPKSTDSLETLEIRETYIIDLNDDNTIIKAQIPATFVSNFPVQANNIPGLSQNVAKYQTRRYLCDKQSGDVKKDRTSCEMEKDEKKKCRQIKKKKLPSCDDIKKNKNCSEYKQQTLPKKSGDIFLIPPENFVFPTDGFTQYVNNLQSEPFKLKPMFWKK